MALIETSERYSVRRLLLSGVPAFLAAAAISIVSHILAHTLTRSALGLPPATVADWSLTATHVRADESPLVALAGPLWTILFGIVALPFFLRKPEGLFRASLVFVNSTLRLPSLVTLIYHLVNDGNRLPPGDENLALQVLPFVDPSARTAVVYFATLFTLFLALTVIHDTKVVPWKWGVALVAFLSLTPLQWGLQLMLSALLG